MDLDRGELRKNGVRLRLHDQPFLILSLLVEANGEMVSREEIVRKLWGDDTFVDFEQSVGAAISKLRRALGDSAATPRYIETVRNRGFRLLVPVVNGEGTEAVATSDPAAVPLPEAAAPEVTAPPAQPAKRRTMVWSAALAAILVVAAGAGLLWRSRAGAANAHVVRSLAILPFRVTHGGEAAEYLGLGTADMLITRLSYLRQIAVRPTSAVRKFAAGEQSSTAAGSELGVDAVLEGNIQDVDGQIRVTVQLVRVPDGHTVWAHTFDEASRGLLNLQDDIARRVAAALASEFTSAERQGIEKKYTSNADAYQAYQKGRYLWSLRAGDALERSIGFFEKAIALDGNYALAYSGLADVYVLLYLYNPARRHHAFERAKEAVQKAIDLDSQLAQAHASRAFTAFYYDWDWRSAEASFRKAIELNPQYSTAHQWYAELLYYTGRFAEATAEIRRAHELDPQSVVINSQLASPAFYSRQWKEAIAVAQEGRKLDPDFLLTTYVIGTAHTELREYDKAVAEFAKIEDHPFGMTGLGFAYARAGEREKAERVLARMLELARRGEISPYQVACVYANLGRKDEAFRWLAQAKAQRDERIVAMLVDSKLDPLRADPRFARLLESAGFHSEMVR